MKQLHLLHIIALISLFCAGIYWIGAIEQTVRLNDFLSNNKDEYVLSRLAAVAAMVVFAFSAVVGWKVRAEKKVLGTIWVLAGIGGIVWMVLMWKSPSHISLVEVFPFWLCYIILGIIGSVYSIQTSKEMPYTLNRNYEEELLDN